MGILWTNFIHIFQTNILFILAYVMKITDLPESIIIEILKYLDLFTLLQTVNRTCQQFYHIVKNTSILWRNFEFEIPLSLTSDDVTEIFRHSICFRKFLLTPESLSCRTDFLDSIFFQGFQKSKHLTSLNLTDSKLSTLSFLQFTPNLEILNLSGCRNLRDVDFIPITTCVKLDQLFLSFTDISPTVLVKLAKTLDLISLDACAVALSLKECKTIVEHLKKLTLFHLSLKEDISTSQFDQEVRNVYQECSFCMY